MNRAEDLQIALSLNDPPLMRAQAGYLSVDAPRSVSTPLTLSELLEKGKNHRPDSVATFPLGMAIDGSVEWADLSNPAMTSMLVAGTAGSGKSVFLRSAIIAMAAGTDAGKLVFTVIDPKRVSFTDLTELPHLAKPVIMDAEPAIETLEQHVCEMENRYKIFEKDGVFDIVEYNRRQPEISRHVIVIDEYADLMTDKDTGKRLEADLQKLCQKGRAAGFHVILSTQRPDSKVVTPLIKANLQLKIALKVTTSANSQVVLDEPGAERLMGNGDMLVGGAVPLVRLQAAIPTKTEIRSALRG
jgi:S-DNA-T family DNA segregation ATPase FtsK/SpoIIIE